MEHRNFAQGYRTRFVEPWLIAVFESNGPSLYQGYDEHQKSIALRLERDRVRRGIYDWFLVPRKFPTSAFSARHCGRNRGPLWAEHLANTIWHAADDGVFRAHFTVRRGHRGADEADGRQSFGADVRAIIQRFGRCSVFRTSRTDLVDHRLQAGSRPPTDAFTQRHGLDLISNAIHLICRSKHLHWPRRAGRQE